MDHYARAAFDIPMLDSENIPHTQYAFGTDLVDGFGVAQEYPSLSHQSLLSQQLGQQSSSCGYQDTVQQFNADVQTLPGAGQGGEEPRRWPTDMPGVSELSPTGRHPLPIQTEAPSAGSHQLSRSFSTFSQSSGGQDDASSMCFSLDSGDGRIATNPFNEAHFTPRSPTSTGYSSASPIENNPYSRSLAHQIQSTVSRSADPTSHLGEERFVNVPHDPGYSSTPAPATSLQAWQIPPRGSYRAQRLSGFQPYYPEASYNENYFDRFIDEDGGEQNLGLNFNDQMFVPDFTPGLGGSFRPTRPPIPEIILDPGSGGGEGLAIGNPHPFDHFSAEMASGPTCSLFRASSPMPSWDLSASKNSSLSVPTTIAGRDRAYSEPSRPTGSATSSSPMARSSTTTSYHSLSIPSPMVSSVACSDPCSPATVTDLELSQPPTNAPATPQTRGRRKKGQLKEEIRLGARKVRKDRTVCIRCKHSKQRCRMPEDNKTGPCSNCAKAEARNRGPAVICVKASFEQIIRSGTLNYISQLAMNHLRLDNKTRVRIDLPTQITIEQILNPLKKVKSLFDIRVSHGDKSIYVLDLDECYQYLLSMKEHLGSRDYNLRTFIDREILKSDDWARCVKECDAKSDQLSLLPIWTNMPSRATFSKVYKHKKLLNGQSVEEDMDVDDYEDRQNVILAGQLSRIVCRKLEVEAYTQLQRLLNDVCKLPASTLLPLLQRLGRILLTLRWRVSWWALLGGGGVAGDDDDAGKGQFEARVTSLCRVLYFFYCSTKRKLPSSTDMAEIRGVRWMYPDSKAEVDDKFPRDETIRGFEAWMEDGKRLIEEAGVVKKLREVRLRD